MKKIVFIFAAMGLLSACNVKMPEPVKVPEFQAPEPPDYDQLMKACDTKESEQPKVSSDVLNAKIVIEDEIATKDIETIDCDGKVIKTERGPERSLVASATLPAPQGLTEPVQYISVANARTCAVHMVDARDEKIEWITKKNKDGKKVPFPRPVPTTEERAGKISIILMESLYKFGTALNVRDGLNVLKIKYYGKCLKPIDEPNPSLSANSYLNCKEAKEIASQDVVLDVKVKRPELNEKKQVQVCEKKK